MLPRSAGVLIPLFSVRTRNDIGRGDIQGLPAMIELAISAGHRIIQLLPIDETAPGQLSPYSALSVLAIDPTFIGAQGLPGVGRVVQGRARDTVGKTKRVVPWQIMRREKIALLERSWKAAHTRGGREDGDALDHFIADNADWIHDYALFRALKERYNWTSWDTWPAEIARRDPAVLEAARRELADQVEMFSYFQFLAHRQWDEVRAYAKSRGAMIGGDLAFSPGRDSAEVWQHQGDFDLTRTVGAPPDGFNPRGQRWGLPLPNWWKMGEGGFKLLRTRVRHASTMFDLIRIDHVVGLYRTFNFPLDPPDPNAPGQFTPANEDEQRRQGEFIMHAIKEEAGESQMIAEDLGTVPPWVRVSLTAMEIPGYKVLQWEKTNWGKPDERYLSPATYPEIALATTGTHDTEPITLWWREQKVKERADLLTALGLAERFSPREMLEHEARFAILEALYTSPAALAIIPVQDLFGWSARVNRPGTVGDSNWTYRLPLSLERMRRSRAIQAQAARLRAIAIDTRRFPVDPAAPK
jgi:4-alpha-glucanotransferase